MYDDDDIDDALQTARSINTGPNAEMVPAYSTANITAGMDPLRGVGSRLGTKWTTTAQDDAMRKRFNEAVDKPTLIGKTLGVLGLDDPASVAARHGKTHSCQVCTCHSGSHKRQGMPRPWQGMSWKASINLAPLAS